jgi:hypothetical protein
MRKEIPLFLVLLASTAQAQDVQFVREAPADCKQVGDLDLAEDNNLELRKRTINRWTAEAKKRGATHVFYKHAPTGVGQQCIPTTVAVPGGLAPGAAMCQSHTVYIIEVRYLVCPVQ